MLASIPMPATLASADARAEGGGRELGAKHQALLRGRLEGLHPVVPRHRGPWTAGSSGRRGPLLGAPGGGSGQGAGHGPQPLGGGLRRPPPGQPSRPGVPAAGEGHAEAVGPGAGEATETGTGSDRRGPGRRGPGRSEGDGTDPAGPPRQAPEEGDRAACGEAGPDGTGPAAGDAGRPAAPLRGGGAPLGQRGVPRGRLRSAEHCEVQDGPGSRGVTLYLGPADVEALLAIRPEAAVIDPATSVFGLSTSQISRRIKAASKMAGLGDGFSAHPAGPVHRGPSRRQGSRGPVLPGGPAGFEGNIGDAR